MTEPATPTPRDGSPRPRVLDELDPARPAWTYTAARPPLPETREQLRARIPGWGVDLDPADRPSFPREHPAAEATGAHWEFPERQPERVPRERSIEHAFLTPVFGTSAPLKGLSGAVRRVAYARCSEARNAHWLLLVAADRVDSLEETLRSFASRHPDDPLTETGVRTELTHGGLSSRFGRGRADVAHQGLDPLLVAGPWVAGAVLTTVLGRRALRALTRRRS